jgi:hypothetical protein
VNRAAKSAPETISSPVAKVVSSCIAADPKTPYFSVIRGILAAEILLGVMRRLYALVPTVVLVASLAFPAAAPARDLAPGEGSLSVDNASGSLLLAGKGLVFGHLDRGTVTVLSYKPDGNSVPTVSGARMRLVGSTTNVVYTGSDMRFLFPGGRYVIEIEGSGIDISAVGRGSISALGAGTIDDGSIVADGGVSQQVGRFPVGALFGANPSKAG